MRKIATTVTYLEMTAEAVHHIVPPSNFKLVLMRAENPTPGFYRFLYAAVGRNYNWQDRNNLSDEELEKLIHAEGVEIWVLYVFGQPAGFFELAPSDIATVELEYLGLIAEFQGKGLGKWLLAEAIRAAWAKMPKRVIVETCTLDGPKALPLYQKLGFAPYDQRTEVRTVPD